MTLLPPGETLLINLPTGSGKSVVGHFPALLGNLGELTVFIVPTTALVIDQEKSFKGYSNNSSVNNITWTSDTPESQRAEIKENIRSGQQRILITSPEAITGSLAFTIIQATKNGYLKNLVVDEAHLITQWGDYFRPDFQKLVGLRNYLLDVARDNNQTLFKTVLLSATYSEETVAVLEKLFSPVQNVSAVLLRPEPQYWIKKAKSFEEKNGIY